jgi:hypothetical protein
MKPLGVSAIAQSCSLACLLTCLAVGCGAEEPATPFKRVFRSNVESSTNRGFMWVAKRPEQPDPDGRYEGGYDLDFHAGLGVCRMRHEGGVHPGKVFAGKCNAGYGHKEISSAEYDLLLARSDAFWHMAPKPGMDLENALIGGREADGKPLKLCVARHRTGFWLLSNHRGYHPGKYVHGKCNVGFGGQEVAADEFYLIALGSRPGTGAGADGGTQDTATPPAERADAGLSGRAAASPDAASSAQANVPGKKNAHAAAAVLPASVDVAPRNSSAPVRPVRCLTAEVACHCEKVSGCTLEGYCPCSP